MRRGAVDVDLLEEGEAEGVLGAHARLDPLRPLRLLVQELVAREGEYLQAVAVQLGEESGELGVPAAGLASEGGDVADEDHLPPVLLQRVRRALGVARAQLEKVGRQLIEAPLLRVGRGAPYGGGEGALLE